MAAVLRASNQLCYFMCFFTLFVLNVASTVSYDQKELLDIRTVVTHLNLDKDLFFQLFGIGDSTQKFGSMSYPK